PEESQLQQNAMAPCRVLVVNSKGGCGKTTIATNLAGCLSSRNYPTVLIDYDPQGSSMQWLSLRSDKQKEVHGIAAYRTVISNTTRSFQMRIPQGTEYVTLLMPQRAFLALTLFSWYAMSIQLLFRCFHRPSIFTPVLTL
ncbi:MAG: ParA family protein, partial [Chromatiales bacterium]|nr:ParA family protein [Chromatiales bacterium]